MEAQDIQRALQQAFGIDLTIEGAVDGGFDPHASALSAIASTGKKYFVKIRNRALPSPSLASALAEIGIREVVAPIRTRSGSEGVEVDGRYLQLFEFREGKNGFERPLSIRQWMHLGEALRKIHSVELPRGVLKNLIFEDYSRKETEQIRALYAKPESRTDQPFREVLVTLEKHQDDVVEKLSEIERLGTVLREASFAYVPCHADLHVGNVLAHEDDTISIIDWDLPRLAPAECDLMFFREGGILNHHGEAEERAFFQGYGPASKEEVLYSFYKLARQIEDIASFAMEAIDLSVSESYRSTAKSWLDRQFDATSN